MWNSSQASRGLKKSKSEILDGWTWSPEAKYNTSGPGNKEKGTPLNKSIMDLSSVTYGDKLSAHHNAC